MELLAELFNINTDGYDTNEKLQGVIKKYPYFTAPNFFLLQYTTPTDPGYNSIAARTALHFNNPFFLNYQLQHFGKNSEVLNDGLKTQISPKSFEVEEIPSSAFIAGAGIENDTFILPVTEKKLDVVASGEIPATNFPNTGEKNNMDELIIEPLFASDYFASQGIKLSEEVQSGDKLGKQLKSFTDWLKSMKKVHDLPQPSEQVEVAIQNLAEKSNREDLIITESMADACIQQGKIKKGTEILQKLSLLNPAKSAYFAAKIDQARSNH